MHLNPLETIPPLQFMEKLSYTNPVPGAKKVGDHFSRTQVASALISSPGQSGHGQV